MSVSISDKIHDEFIEPISRLVNFMCNEEISSWKSDRTAINKTIITTLNLINLNGSYHEKIIEDTKYRVKGRFDLCAANAIFAYLYHKHIERKNRKQKELSEQLEIIIKLIEDSGTGEESAKDVIIDIDQFIKSEHEHYTGFHPALYYLLFIYAYCLSIAVNDQINDDYLLFDDFTDPYDMKTGKWSNRETTRRYQRMDIVEKFILEYGKRHGRSVDATIIKNITSSYNGFINVSPFGISEKNQMYGYSPSMHYLMLLVILTNYHTEAEKWKAKKWKMKGKEYERVGIIKLINLLIESNFNVIRLPSYIGNIINEKYYKRKLNPKELHDLHILLQAREFFRNPDLINDLFWVSKLKGFAAPLSNKTHCPINAQIQALTTPNCFKNTFGIFFDYDFRNTNIYYHATPKYLGADLHFIYVATCNNPSGKTLYHIIDDDNFNIDMKITKTEMIYLNTIPAEFQGNDLESLLKDFDHSGDLLTYSEMKGGHTAIELFELIIILIVIIIVIVVAIYVVKRFTMKRPCEKYN